MSVEQKDRNRVEVTVNGEGCGSGSDYRRENGSGSENKNWIEWAGWQWMKKTVGVTIELTVGKRMRVTTEMVVV